MQQCMSSNPPKDRPMIEEKFWTRLTYYYTTNWCYAGFVFCVPNWGKLGPLLHLLFSIHHYKCKWLQKWPSCMGKCRQYRTIHDIDIPFVWFFTSLAQYSFHLDFSHLSYFAIFWPNRARFWYYLKNFLVLSLSNFGLVLVISNLDIFRTFPPNSFWLP